MIAVENVSKSFDGGASFAVRRVNLRVPARTFVAIVGDSGSGKTTLLKTINRLIEPQEGEVLIDEEPVRTVAPHTLRRRIGYVFQGIGLFPHLSIAENIGITPRLIGWPEPQIRARVEELIDLAARPYIMLMDEPFGALDPVTRDALGAEYRRLHESMGLTTLMVTHDILEAVLLAERIVVMRAGNIVADGEPHDLLSGHPDPEVRTLMDMPRRQAERVRALLEERARD